MTTTFYIALHRLCLRMSQRNIAKGRQLTARGSMYHARERLEKADQWVRLAEQIRLHCAAAQCSIAKPDLGD